MDTVPHASSADRGEARFFFLMAALMAATIVAGFSFNLSAGRSSFAAPLHLHLHALVFMGWVALFLLQNTLVFAGHVALHRRLGWLAVAWLPAMVVVALMTTRYSLQDRGGPPFFDQNQFLFSSALVIFGFAGMAIWALKVRRNSGWHRRLMLCAFALLTGPAFGRLLPMPLLVPYAWYLSSILLPLLFPLLGLLADRRRYGRAHPAWLWGIGLILALQIAADLLAYSPLGFRFTEWFLAGTPGAERSMTVFAPPI